MEQRSGTPSDTSPRPAQRSSLSLFYPLTGLLLGGVSGQLLALAAWSVESLRPWLQTTSFVFGREVMDNAAGLLFFSVLAGLTWGFAYWFIRDRRDLRDFGPRPSLPPRPRPRPAIPKQALPKPRRGPAPRRCGGVHSRKQSAW